jgi:nucleolar protein 4
MDEQDLRALFLPFGPIYSVHIPTSALTEGESTDGDGAQTQAKRRGRGFAFVWMLSKADAAKALEGVNGTTVRAGLAARLAEEKQMKKKDVRLERKNESVKDGDDAEIVAGSKERVVAVDWALSKDRWEEEKTRLEEEAVEDVEMNDAGSSESDLSDSSSEDDEDDHGLGIDDDEDSEEDENADSEDEEDERDDDDEAPVKPQLPQTDVGTTLFVRNVPYEATEDELRHLWVLVLRVRFCNLRCMPDCVHSGLLGMLGSRSTQLQVEVEERVSRASGTRRTLIRLWRFLRH